MAKLETPVLAEDCLYECEEENAVNQRENSQRLAEETASFVQKKLHRRELENVDNKHNCNIEELQVIGVELLSKIQNLENRFAHAFIESGISELPVAEFYEKIQLFLAELKQLCTLYLFANPRGTPRYDGLEILRNSDLISQTQQSSPYLRDNGLVTELSAKLFEIDKLKSENLLKDNELEALRHQQKELEAHICSIEKQKSELEENVEIMRREVVVTAKFLDDLRSEMMELNSNMDSRISANKILKKMPSKLEDGKQEMEAYLSELEEEILLLSEGLSGLEEKSMYPTDKKESHHMELQIPESDAMNFKDEIIRRLEDEMEVQKFVMRWKIEEMQRQWSVVQEECEHLKIENLKLIEECSKLQKANGDLRKQKMEINGQCMVLEVESKESENIFSNILNKVDNLQRENQLLEEEISAQLQKKVLLQDEILALKETISEIYFENEMLEVSVVMLSRDYEELEAEATLFVQKVFNSCRCGKASLEEALGTQEALLKNELAHIQVDNKRSCNTESPQFMGVKLAEVLEADDMCKAQLNSLLSKDVSIHLDVPEKSTGEGAERKDRHECKVPTLEIEMSARYQIC